MSKGGSVWKLKHMIKKWQRSSKGGTSGPLSSRSVSVIPSKPSSESEEAGYGCLGPNQPVPRGYQTIYVGKSRRRHVIRSDHLNHPLVRELVQESEGSDSVVIGCEVILFEHLLWMLENADPTPDSMDELAGFYVS